MWTSPKERGKTAAIGSPAQATGVYATTRGGYFELPVPSYYCLTLRSLPMLLGHYGVALAAKSAAPRASLGTFNFAAQLLDELWPIFVLLGIEHVRVTPGITAANPLEFMYYPITHSLVGAIGWGVLLGLLYYAVRRYRRGAIVVGLLVLSHWILDLPMHRPDLPLWPGSDVKVGLGAWQSVPLTFALELAVFVPGLIVYQRTTRSKDRIGRWGLWAMVIVLLAIFFSGFTSPPPESERAVALAALGLWLFVPWGYWVDRHREVVPAANRGAVSGVFRPL